MFKNLGAFGKKYCEIPSRHMSYMYEVGFVDNYRDL